MRKPPIIMVTEIKETAAGITVSRRAAKPLAFHGSTPVAQRAGAAQALVTKGTGAVLGGTLTGTLSGALADLAPIALSTTDTYSDAAVNGAVNAVITAANLQAKELQARVNQLVSDNAASIVLVNELRAALVEKGLIKGAA